MPAIRAQRAPRASEAPPTFACMLRALNPNQSARSHAYRVPWHIDREQGPHAIVTNDSESAVDFVRVFVGTDSSTATGTQLWGQMLPGEACDLCLCNLDPADVVVTLAWFRPENGVEYVWRFVL